MSRTLVLLLQLLLPGGHSPAGVGVVHEAVILLRILLHRCQVRDAFKIGALETYEYKMESDSPYR